MKAPFLNPALRGFYETAGIRNYVLYGGRGSSKTYHTAAYCIYLAMRCRVNFLCVRQFQNRISDSVKTVLEECIYSLEMQRDFRITKTSIEYPATGSTFKFYGIQRHINDIKGLANIDVLWIEEAEDLGEQQWKILEPTIRAESSKVFVVFNPRLVTDFVYQRFVAKPPQKTLARKINYNENPHLSETLRDTIEALKAEDYDEYLHIYGGEPLTNDEDSVIKRSWLLAAVDGHKTLGIEPRGLRRLGFDVADAGEDSCALIDMHGSVAIGSDLWKAREDELLKSCTRAWHKARAINASIIYDAIGVGASAGAKFNELNAGRLDPVRHQKFFAGGAVMKPDAKYSGIKNRDFFANIKAQAWWLVADRFRNAFNAVRNGAKFRDDEMLFLDSSMPHLAQLIDELCTPKRDYDAAGRVKVESKKDLAKRDIASPNLADAFIEAAILPQLKAPLQISDAALRMAAG